MVKIKIERSDIEFDCRESESLLHAARRNGGIPIPAGCFGGGCGMCKIQVVDGQFERGTCSKAVLTDQERDANFSLACKTFPKSDLTVAI
jgi:CDP-4-dehydro-6-deoxyglucose reductase